MKYIHAMLAVVGLLVVGGAIGAARADDRAEENEGVTLYTPPDIGDIHNCRAVNVSDKTLGITVALLRRSGDALSCDSPITCTVGVGAGPADMPTTNPTPEFQVLKGTFLNFVITAPSGSPSFAYCAFAVSGTDNRDDVRVAHAIAATRTIPGTTIPSFQTRIVEGH
jgi:hypothetical protein